MLDTGKIVKIPTREELIEKIMNVAEMDKLSELLDQQKQPSQTEQ